MKIFYVTNARLPTEKAHGLATVKLCEAFAKQGVEVTVFAPWRLNSLKADPYEYYGVERNFRIRYLPSIDLLWLPFGKQFFFGLQIVSFSIIATLWFLIRYGISGGLRDAVVFSHDHVPLFFVSFFAPRIFYDVHDYPRRTGLYTRVLQRAVGIAVQTKWKVTALARDFGIPAGRVVYWPNGTDIERFDISVSQREARAKLGLPQDKKVVLYSGSLLPWKGVDTLVAAARSLPGDTAVYIIGGEGRDVERLKALAPDPQTLSPVFVGQRPWAEIPIWLKAADVLILPNTGREEISLRYTSPMKLFEYMASGRPIVASNIPSIREIVDETMAFFATPDDPQSFAEVIQQVFALQEEATRRADRARQTVRQYTWDVRAAKVISAVRFSSGQSM